VEAAGRVRRGQRDVDRAVGAALDDVGQRVAVDVGHLALDVERGALQARAVRHRPGRAAGVDRRLVDVVPPGRLLGVREGPGRLRGAVAGLALDLDQERPLGVPGRVGGRVLELVGQLGAAGLGQVVGRRRPVAPRHAPAGVASRRGALDDGAPGDGADPVHQVGEVGAGAERVRGPLPRRLHVVEEHDHARRRVLPAGRDAVLDGAEDRVAVGVLPARVLLVVVAHPVAVAVLDPVEHPADLGLAADPLVAPQARLLLVAVAVGGPVLHRDQPGRLLAGVLARAGVIGDRLDARVVVGGEEVRLGGGDVAARLAQLGDDAEVGRVALDRRPLRVAHDVGLDGERAGAVGVVQRDHRHRQVPSDSGRAAPPTPAAPTPPWLE